MLSRSRLLRFLALCLCSLVLTLAASTFTASVAQTAPSDVPTDPHAAPHTAVQLVERGLSQYRNGEYQAAIALWQTALQSVTATDDRLTIRRNLASAYQRLGQPQDALLHWQAVLDLIDEREPTAANHEDDRHVQRQRAIVRTEQAQAYDAIGQHSRALRLLEGALDTFDRLPDARDGRGDRELQTARAAAWGALGNARWALGNYDGAIAAQQTSLDLARQIEHPDLTATALSNLANTYSSRARRYRYQAEVAESEGELDDATEAIAEYERDRQRLLFLIDRSLVFSARVGGVTEVRALVNADRIFDEFAEPDGDRFLALSDRLTRTTLALPDSRDKIFALIRIAERDPAVPSAARHLETAIAIARRLGDRRAESFALGTLGELYETRQQYATALQLTQQAEFAAQEVRAFDSLYRWQWQAGRIYAATDRGDRALTSYRSATDTLAEIRSDILATSKDLQFDFRDAVEPVYRQYISLLLQPETPGAKQDKLREVLNVLEQLKLAELQNFFGDECVDVAQSIVAENGRLVDPDAAAVYTILFDDRTAILLQQADGTLSDYIVPISAEMLQDEVDEFRRLLEKRGTNEYLDESQRLYNWLVRPLADDLAAIAPKTVVFIQDGGLRKTPVAALYDGQQFLVEKYALATTPSLALTTTSNPDFLDRSALIVGLTVEVPPFPPLNNVANEVEKVNNLVGGTKLLDADFTVDNFEEKLTEDSYALVHMATHGKFGIDAESTFLLAYDNPIRIDEVDRLLRSRQMSGSSRQPLELLVLSACQTAAGDNRSALGIAGVAVRAGAKSALATLWFINDAATVPLVENFYTYLKQPGVSKAEALRQAQLQALNDPRYRHPGVWSPFILIGSWQ